MSFFILIWLFYFSSRLKFHLCVIICSTLTRSLLQLNGETIRSLVDRIFKNYRSWCNYLRCKSHLRLVNLLLQIINYLTVISKTQTIFISYSTIWTPYIGCMDYFLLCRFQKDCDRQQLELIYISLYLLIWGEASNIRFMPECICYIFHNVCFFLYILMKHYPWLKFIICFPLVTKKNYYL